MNPLSYIDLMKQRYESLGFPAYRWSINHDAPLTRLEKPLTDCAVSLLTSGGVSKKGVPGFNPDARNDFRVDEIEWDTPSSGFNINDNYYRHTDAEIDINCIFAIERLREFAERGEVGRATSRLWSGFMGRTYMRGVLVDEVAPAFARKLKEDGTDVLVAVPACPLDHQTIGLVCRVVEEAGIPTVCISTGRDLTAQVKPPRSLFVNFPMGNPFGKAGDIATQSHILRLALDLAVTAEKGGVLVDAPFEWTEAFGCYLPEPDREYQLRK
jgi:D-proline reductase (dithiol) PrdB